MIAPETSAQINGARVLLPDAGPAWRAAAEFGFDVSLVEDALRQTSEQRLDEPQQLLNVFLEVPAACIRRTAIANS